MNIAVTLDDGVILCVIVEEKYSPMVGRVKPKRYAFVANVLHDEFAFLDKLKKRIVTGRDIFYACSTGAAVGVLDGVGDPAGRI
jgi:hypothetical protein